MQAILLCMHRRWDSKLSLFVARHVLSASLQNGCISTCVMKLALQLQWCDAFVAITLPGHVPATQFSGMVAGLFHRVHRFWASLAQVAWLSCFCRCLRLYSLDFVSNVSSFLAIDAAPDG
jgi:hypothetical protein